jgi:branched-chain amino acid transport system permease protein
MDIAGLIQTSLLSVAVAGLYAAVASGLTLEFGVTRIVNFAHGEFVMLGAFITYFLYSDYGFPFIACVAIAGTAMAFLSYLVFVTFLARVLKQDEHNQFLATLGLSILIVNVAAVLWTPDARSMHPENLLPALQLGGATLPGNNLLVILISAVMYGALILFMRYTRYGIQMRMASSDIDLAKLCGVDVDRVFTLSFVIGGFTAGVAGSLVALILYVHPLVGLDLVIRAFAIVALGGLGSIAGAMIGAFILSLAEGFVSTFVPQGGSWGFGVAFVLIVLVLIIRPTGFFGRSIQT